MKNCIFLFVATVLFSACGSDTRTLEDYGDLQNLPDGIRLTDASKHRGGWGRSECVTCHNISLNVHRSDGSTIDPSQLKRAFETRGGDAYCLTCHGPNGL